MDYLRSSCISAVIVIAFAGLCASATGLSHAQAIQKWVDENGKVHYGDSPPPGAKTKSVKVQEYPQYVPPPKSVESPVTKSGGDTKKNPAAKEASEQESRAGGEAAARSQTTKECQTRIATLHQRVNAYHNLARQGGTTAGSDADLDRYAAQEDAWIAKNCDGR